MSHSKNLYVTILAIAFIYNAFRSYFKILEEPTTFEETELKYSARFPSVTFCLRLPLKDDYTDSLSSSDSFIQSFKKEGK